MRHSSKENIFDYFARLLYGCQNMYILSDLVLSIWLDLKQQQKSEGTNWNRTGKAHCTVWCRGQFIEFEYFWLKFNYDKWYALNNLASEFGQFAIQALCGSLASLWSWYRCKQDQISNIRKKRAQKTSDQQTSLALKWQFTSCTNTLTVLSRQ